ncbi:MAG: proline dehydrogenase family protein, partial [Acidobacteriota bacterium]
MFAGLSKATFSALAGSGLLKKMASRYGMQRPGSFGRRFVAGESIADAIDVARKLEQRGLHVTLDYLGEHQKSREGVAEATRAYIAIADAAIKAGISRNISLKLTQLGLDIDRATAIDNVRRVLESVLGADLFVRIDMESSAYTDETFETFETLWSIGYRDIGIVVQAYLRKATEQVRRMNALGARVRLVKGAYRESSKVAFPDI